MDSLTCTWGGWGLFMPVRVMAGFQVQRLGLLPACQQKTCPRQMRSSFCACTSFTQVVCLRTYMLSPLSVTPKGFRTEPVAEVGSLGTEWQRSSFTASSSKVGAVAQACRYSHSESSLTIIQYMMTFQQCLMSVYFRGL